MVACLHKRDKSETFWYCEAQNSHMINLVPKLLKSIMICKSYCKKFTATFYGPHCKILPYST